ncbi:protein kinase domain-containing protein [Streptomyces sp. NPDC003374]
MNTWAVPGYTESLELGSGASGRVVLAVHEETGVPVAVKYLSDALRTRAGFVDGFRTEARLLGGLDSPHVAGLYEYVESPGGAAIVMELVDGVSLRTLLGRRGPLEPEAALVMLKGSLLGLAAAHNVGVVHRDYKPENVLVMPDGTSKLVDFGIAVDAGGGSGVAGTPSYMAPEQWTGAPASPAADVYAATATFFECLTGHRPYSGDNLAELALRHVDAPVPAEEVPERVRSLVLRGLAKSPRQRPAHAREFVAELEAVAGAAYGPGWEERGRRGLAALVALLPLLLPSARSAPRTTTDTARTVLAGRPDPGWARWRPTVPGMLVAGAALLLALVLTYGSGRPADTAQPAARAVATTSARPGLTPAAPARPPTAPATSATPAPPDPATSGPSGTATAHPPASGPADTPSPPVSGPASATASSGEPTAGGTPTASTPATTTPGAPPAPAVKDVTISSFRRTGPSTATATLTVTTDGTGPVTVSVAWYTSSSKGEPGTPDGEAQSLSRSGATTYTLTVDHGFLGAGCYWTVRATTVPAAADGGASQQLLARGCDIR